MASSTLTHTLLLLSLLFLLTQTASSARCNKDDKKALLAIKSAFNNSYHFASWTNTSGCCEWYDIECDPNTDRVTALTVFSDNIYISGTIPDAVGDLPYLTTLQFHHLSMLTGSVPSSLTKLTRLTQLDLSYNSLSGPIPAFLGNMTSLTLLSLNYNQFSGSIPASLANLPNLLALHLDRNALTGPIPASFGTFPKSSPPDLYLSHNNLSGAVPASLGVPDWGTIDLSRNKLTGDATFLFGGSKKSTDIDLSRNEFMFDLTAVSFPVGLGTLDLNHNMIYGSIPAQVNQLSGLGLFNVSYNRLCGEIPAGAVTAKFDQYSYLHNKCLCGAPLPACN